MSTERDSEVSGTDAALVPPQSAPRTEGPTKLRTLSAVELHRLTVDTEGRFYWDGHLVNSQGGSPAHPLDPATVASNEQAALDMLERAAHEITEGTPLPASAEPQGRARDFAATAPAADSTAPGALVAPPAPISARRSGYHVVESEPLEAPPDALSQRLRLRLSVWQSVGAVLVVVALLAAAASLATQGLIAAHEWSCRAGWAQAYCPKPPAPPAPPPRMDLPA